MVDQHEDTQEKQEQYTELLDSLSREERDACEYMTTSDWQTGVDIDFLHDACEISDPTINSLIIKEVLESKPGWEFSQEAVDQLQGEFDAIEQKRRAYFPNFSLSDLESDMLDNYGIYKRIAEDRDMALRYRFKDPNFQEYVKSNMEDEDPT